MATPTDLTQKSSSSAFEEKTRNGTSIDQLNFLAVLAIDAFGKLMLAEAKTPHRVYAVKVLEKTRILKNQETKQVRAERSVYLKQNRERNPFLIAMHACLQNEACVLFVTEYLAGGTLLQLLQRGEMAATHVPFYGAEICLALKSLHEQGVLHRNLHLENVLIGRDGHIKIADYGLCKEEMVKGARTSTFCGTAPIMAPEVLLDTAYGLAADWWLFGVVLFQMAVQKMPFMGEDEDEVYDAILEATPIYPADLPANTTSIIKALLLRDPDLRLGSGPTDAVEVMQHSFFHDIVWEDVYAKKTLPPFIPTLSSVTDTRYFDAELTALPFALPALSVNSASMPVVQETFQDFDYTADFT